MNRLILLSLIFTCRYQTNFKVSLPSSVSRLHKFDFPPISAGVSSRWQRYWNSNNNDMNQLMHCQRGQWIKNNKVDLNDE